MATESENNDVEEDSEPVIGGASAASRISLLSDDPADSDAFDGGGHDAVARNIAGLIAAEPGGKVIGLEGSWGSGKSTVVRLVRKHLSDAVSAEPDAVTTCTVIFDAWSHQGDPLRRTFLEKLIADLCEAGWIDPGQAKNYVDKLTGKVSTTTTESTASLSAEGKAAAVAAAFVPIGLALFAHKFRQSLEVPLHILGFAFLVAPLFVVAGFVSAHLVGLVLKGPTRSEADWRHRLSDMDPLGLFANSQDTQTRTEGIERGEPTSVEFQRTFWNVLDGAMNSSRRLVVVLDNLDRVEESDARTILATMQTFTQADSSPPAAWAGNLWMLIPYDPAGLDRLWTLTSGLAEQSAEEDRAFTAAAFVEKLFQVRFETPPLVLSDWRGYLLHLFEEALGNSAGDLGRVLSLRALYPTVNENGVVARETPTPRQLKQFVNQVGGLRRQHGDMDLVHIAYYALLRRDRLEVASMLTADQLPHSPLAYLLGGAVGDDLAALYFGTSPTIAQQLLLGPALERALGAQDADTLSRLSARAGFIDALDTLRVQDWVSEGGVALTRAASVLQASGVFGSSATAPWIKSALLPLARAAASWTLSGRESGLGLAALFSRLVEDDDAVLGELLAKVEPQPSDADSDGALQIAGAAGLADGLTSSVVSVGDSDYIDIKIPQERLVSTVAAFRAEITEEASRAMFEVASTTPVDLAQALVETVPESKAGDVTGMLDVLLARPAQVALTNLATGLLARFTAQDPTAPDEVLGSLSVVDRARQHATPEEIIGSAADNGTLMHLLAFCQNQNWPREAAASSMLHLVVRPGLAAPQVLRESATGIELMRRVMTTPAGEALASAQGDWCREHKSEALGLCISVVQADQAFQPWVSYMVTTLRDAGDLVVSATQYRAQWKWLKSMVGDEYFGKLSRSLFGSARARETIISEDQDAGLAVVAVELIGEEMGDEYASDIRGWASGIVKDTTQDDWETALRQPEGDPRLTLGLALSGTRHVPSGLAGLADALHTHFEAVTNGESVWQPDAATFAKLTALLASATRRALASQLCAELEGRGGSIGGGLVATYGGFLAGEKTFRQHPKLPNVIERLVAHDQWSELEWVVDLAKAHSDTLDPSERADEIAYLREKVAAKLNELQDDPPGPLTELAKLLDTSPDASS